ERQTDQSQRDDNDDPGVRDLYAERLEPATDPALRREDGRERYPRDRGRQRERQIDDRVDDAPPRKAIADERPRDDETEHRVQRRRQQRRAEAQPIRRERS